MTLENKLGLTNPSELAREEERISKKKAVELFENGLLDKMPAGTFATLQAIHTQLFPKFIILPDNSALSIWPKAIFALPH